MIQPRKLFFMAVDGVAPRAKMNQQRGRRFRSAGRAETLETEARKKGEILPESEKFDSNCITPGTVFMARLNEQLRYFVTRKITTDKIWQNCKVVLSGHETPGEGEHKIMDYIRYMKSQPNWDSNTRHCLYGLDADLIMLGLCTHEPNFSLLREDADFGKRQKRVSAPDATKFLLLHLSMLREYIKHEFSSLEVKMSFEYDIEKVIDDWVLMGFLIGNDFIPHLPNLHIADGALPILYSTYMEVLPTLDEYLEGADSFLQEMVTVANQIQNARNHDAQMTNVGEQSIIGYLNESGTLILHRFEEFMRRLSRVDIEQFTDHQADRWGHSTRTKSSRDWESHVHKPEFVQHKRDYYMNKLGYENVDGDVLRSQAECYVRGIQWNLNYYYNGCCSWSWYYPHHYAPYISDVKDFRDSKFEFETGQPLLPFQQLLAVLPAASRSLLPEPFRSLMIDGQSPIIDYYPAEYKTDLNGKRQEWEALVLIPFIEEATLLQAMQPCYAHLTEDEKRRNSLEPMCVYSYTIEDLGSYESPDYFPNLSTNHAQLELIDWKDVIVPRDKLAKGLSPGTTRPDAYFPGFPTLKYIEHTAGLQKAETNAKSFNQASGDMMLISILPSSAWDLAKLANQILGTSVFVSWPNLVEARVVAVSNHETIFKLMGDPGGTVVKKRMERSLTELWNRTKSTIAEDYLKRLGINIGETKVLVHARLMIGRRYVFGGKGKLSLAKQWSVPSAFALQATTRDANVQDSSFVQYKNIGQIFTPKSICFIMRHPHYGAMGEVAKIFIHFNICRIKLTIRITGEPNLESLRETQSSSKLHYMYGPKAAEEVRISSHLFSRITGTILVKEGRREQLETPKHNLGLNLKFNKKNEEVPGYTKKVEGQWLYSTKCVDSIKAYQRKYPLLIKQLAKMVKNDIFHEDELFPRGSMKMNEVLAWLKEQPFYEVESRSCDVEGLELEDVEKLEKLVDAFTEGKENGENVEKTVTVKVKPDFLYKYSLHIGNVPPDATAEHNIYDRIVSVRENFTVPFGYRGTIVAIRKAKRISDSDVFDVVFDKSFAGALSVSMCSANRGYRLLPPDFINLSHGVRASPKKALLSPGEPNADDAGP